jgi:hypothetical protein
VQAERRAVSIVAKSELVMDEDEGELSVALSNDKKCFKESKTSWQESAKLAGRQEKLHDPQSFEGERVAWPGHGKARNS